MTKIPSVEELINKMQVGKCITGFQRADLLTALTALLTELREWAEENIEYVNGDQDKILAHLDELINSTK